MSKIGYGDIKMYVAYHKLCKQLSIDELYVSLHVGKAVAEKDLGIQGDNTGDHISEKNPTFCETTGLYWMWKNTTDQFIGLSHYRRYFSKRDKNWLEKIQENLFWLIGLRQKRKGLIYADTTEVRQAQILDKKTAEKFLEEYDLILPVKRKLKRSIGMQYAIRRPKNDFTIVRQIIEEKQKAYLRDFDHVMSGREIYACNMFLMSKTLFDEYMEWLFPILFELEKRTDLSDYSAYHQRIYGFVSERLLLVWLQQKTLKIKELPVLYFKSV